MVKQNIGNKGILGTLNHLIGIKGTLLCATLLARMFPYRVGS